MVSTTQRKAAKKKIDTRTTAVVPTSSGREGQETLLSSFLTSRKKSIVRLKIFLIFSKNRFIALLMQSDSVGRPGGTRTPNMRFWRPPLYQLELLACKCPLASFLVCRMKPACIAKFLHFQSFCRSLLVLRSRIVAILTLGAFQSYNVAHDFSLPIDG